MRWMLFVIAAVVLACKGKADKDNSSTGSALAAPRSSEEGPGRDPANAPEPKPLTDAEQAKRYKECLELSNAVPSDAYRGCFAERVTFYAPGRQGWIGYDEEVAEANKRRAEKPGYRRDPQLTIAGGGHVFAIVLVSAGPSVGMLAGHHVRFDSEGKIDQDTMYCDAKSPRPVASPWATKVDLMVIGQATTEAFAPARAHNKLIDAFETRDSKVIRKRLADDLVWSDQSLAEDLDKAKFLASFEERYRDAKKLRFDTPILWVSGSYVAVVESAIITARDGKQSSSTHVAFYRFDGDQVTQAWTFED